MAKKVRCSECSEFLNWSLPENINDKNIDHAKHCLRMAKRTFVCGRTTKTKLINNEQYCKHFCKALYNIDYNESINELERKINEYEVNSIVNYKSEIL